MKSVGTFTSGSVSASCETCGPIVTSKSSAESPASSFGASSLPRTFSRFVLCFSSNCLEGYETSPMNDGVFATY